MLNVGGMTVKGDKIFTKLTNSFAGTELPEVLNF
jgi:hypothetical protein